MKLQQSDIDAIAHKVAVMIRSKKSPSTYVGAREAARILGISRSRLYHILDSIPHKKAGDTPQSRLLFDSQLLQRLLDNRPDR